MLLTSGSEGAVPTNRGGLRNNASLSAYGAELWSAAACCRFSTSQLAGWDLCKRSKLARASSRRGKRQQAAALQSFAPLFPWEAPNARATVHASARRLEHGICSGRVPNREALAAAAFGSARESGGG